MDEMTWTDDAGVTHMTGDDPWSNRSWFRSITCKVKTRDSRYDVCWVRADYCDPAGCREPNCMACLAGSANP